MIKKIMPLLILALLMIEIPIAQQVTLKPLGKIKIDNRVFAVQLKGYLYSIDDNGIINKTSLVDGSHSPLGKDWFLNVRFFFGINNSLYIIETDGSMKQIDAYTGTSRSMSEIGSWSPISRAFPVGNDLFTIENGTLYYHPTLRHNTRTQIGKGDFFNLKNLLLNDSSLHTVIGGNFYEINTHTGEWKQIGERNAWRNFKTGAVIKNKLYMLENSGTLFENSLPDGEKKLLDNTQFDKALFMFTDSDKLYYMTTRYELFEIIIAGK